MNGLKRRKPFKSPARSDNRLRVIPVVGDGNPVTYMKIEGGICPWKSHVQFHRTYPPKAKREIALSN